MSSLTKNLGCRLLENSVKGSWQVGVVAGADGALSLHHFVAASHLY